MLENVPTILSAQEILDKAFLKANKLEVPDPDKYHRVRKTEEVQMKHISQTCADTLQRYVKAFPNLERSSAYEREVLDILVGLDPLRQALGKVDWTQEKLRDVFGEVAAAMRRERHVEGIKMQKRRFSGRASSLLYDCDKALSFLRDTRDKARPLPTIHPEYATVVIAGFPNVGKSSLLAAWTRASPEIAVYAFTTKQANVGHFEVERRGVRETVQVVDTPGLLDRPDAQRNPVERHAIAALRNTADAVLFLLDPSTAAGCSIEEQERLLAQVRRDMAGVPLVVAETKADLPAVRPTPEGRLRISTQSKAGLEELQRALVAQLPGVEPELERDPLELWRSKRDPLFG